MSHSGSLGVGTLGELILGAGPFTLQMRDRLLMFTRSEHLLGWVTAKALRTERLLEVCQEIVEAFDLTTATGDRLDRLGGILQRPRLGMTDARYRVLLQIQVLLILTTTASTPVILRVVELFTGFAPLAYSEHYPSGYRVDAVIDPDDVPLLLELLRQATAATYAVTLAANDEDALILDYTTDDPVDGAGTLDYTTADPVDGAGTLGSFWSL